MFSPKFVKLITPQKTLFTFSLPNYAYLYVFRSNCVTAIFKTFQAKSSCLLFALLLNVLTVRSFVRLFVVLCFFFHFYFFIGFLSFWIFFSLFCFRHKFLVIFNVDPNNVGKYLHNILVGQILQIGAVNYAMTPTINSSDEDVIII